MKKEGVGCVYQLEKKTGLDREGDAETEKEKESLRRFNCFLSELTIVLIIAHNYPLRRKGKPFWRDVKSPSLKCHISTNSTNGIYHEADQC